jgi:hypothetical protein
MEQTPERRMWWLGWIVAVIAIPFAVCALWGEGSRVASLTRLVDDLRVEGDSYYTSLLSVAAERDILADRVAELQALLSADAAAAPTAGVDIHDCWPVTSSAEPCLSPSVAPLDHQHALAQLHTPTQFEDAVLWCFDAGIAQGYMTSCVQDFLGTAW